jgi:hypothetical protein
MGDRPQYGERHAPQRHFRLAAILVGICLALLLAPANAAADPVVTFECSPAPANCSGWYRTNVSLDWTVAPSSATVLGGCLDRTFTTDTSGINQVCSARDGNITSTLEVTIKVDKTLPVVTGGQPARGADVNGWYNHAIKITFIGSDLTSGVASCTAPTYGGPDLGNASVNGTCQDNAGNTSTPFPYGLKYDETGPLLTGASAERQPNAAGWFNDPIRFDIQATDATSGIADCPSVTYGGPDSAAASFNASCRDLAGNPANRSFALKYDATAPSVTGATPERPPNAGGWFNHPVRFDLLGTDATSGIAGCPSVTYGGPESATASFTGSCSDRAGNTAGRSFSLKYDATPPMLTDVKAAGNDASVTVTWRTGADTQSVEVVRTPGVGLDSETSVFRGLAGGFVDARVQNGVRYAYDVRASDPAGNTSNAITAGMAIAKAGPDVPVPGPTAQAPRRSVPPRLARLLGPKRGSIFRRGHPPLLRWTPVRGATYYNLQLSRLGRKMLSTWPTRARYRVKKHWSYGGRKWRLAPGKYRWIVWPGFGKRSKADYGRRIGASTFRVVARR